MKYSKQKAYHLAKLSELVYQDFSLTKLSNTKFYEVEDTQAMLIEFDDHVDLVFRGTEATFLDVLTDARIIRVGDVFGHVHVGFKKALDLVFRNIVIDLLDTNKPIYITGHSLGGALATLMSARLWAMDIEHDTYTFGCPRVGSKTFRKEYNSIAQNRHHRYVNNNDIVTNIPSEFLGYYHVGILHYFMEDSRQADDLNWWQMKKDSWAGIAHDILKYGLDSVTDHPIKHYRCNTLRSISNG